MTLLVPCILDLSQTRRPRAVRGRRWRRAAGAKTIDVSIVTPRGGGRRSAGGSGRRGGGDARGPPASESGRREPSSPSCRRRWCASCARRRNSDDRPASGRRSVRRAKSGGRPSGHEPARQLTFWQGLGLVGAVGWMVSCRRCVGALVGRWLDARFGIGIFWTLSLLVGGRDCWDVPAPGGTSNGSCEDEPARGTNDRRGLGLAYFGGLWLTVRWAVRGPRHAALARGQRN